MKVVICDDNDRQRQYIYTVLKKYAFIQYPSVDFIINTGNPDEVLLYLENNRVDCCFLDIELEHRINGLELARNIRNQNPHASIIFVTTHAEMLKLTFTYKLAALDFIVKREDKEISNDLREALDAAFDYYEQLGGNTDSPYFQLNIGELIKNLPYDQIIFFTTSERIHKIQLYTLNGIYEFYGKIKEIENLNKNLYRCHKSYIINLQHIQEINKKERTLKMINGEICPISFRAMRKLQDKLSEFRNLQM